MQVRWDVAVTLNWAELQLIFGLANNANVLARQQRAANPQQPLIDALYDRIADQVRAVRPAEAFPLLPQDMTDAERATVKQATDDAAAVADPALDSAREIGQGRSPFGKN